MMDDRWLDYLMKTIFTLTVIFFVVMIAGMIVGLVALIKLLLAF
jgi:hypothetical protein